MELRSISEGKNQLLKVETVRPTVSVVRLFPLDLLHRAQHRSRLETLQLSPLENKLRLRPRQPSLGRLIRSHNPQTQVSARRRLHLPRPKVLAQRLQPQRLVVLLQSHLAPPQHRRHRLRLAQVAAPHQLLEHLLLRHQQRVALSSHLGPEGRHQLLPLLDLEPALQRLEPQQLPNQWHRPSGLSNLDRLLEPPQQQRPLEILLLRHRLLRRVGSVLEVLLRRLLWDPSLRRRLEHHQRVLRPASMWDRVAVQAQTEEAVELFVLDVLPGRDDNFAG
mmetsp:Transcript_30573/g.45270  ORF Transcript_30573/g.45270 Transcript_30573/m.45270 type:complete len:277 (-) Transcript_30573:132-962(-)